jgi:hypothetical protein
MDISYRRRGIRLLGILFLLLYYVFFHAVMENSAMWQKQKQGSPPAEFFALFKWFYVFMGAWFLVSCALNLIPVGCLRARRHRTFSLVVAGNFRAYSLRLD